MSRPILIKPRPEDARQLKAARPGADVLAVKLAADAARDYEAARGGVTIARPSTMLVSDQVLRNVTSEGDTEDDIEGNTFTYWKDVDEHGRFFDDLVGNQIGPGGASNEGRYTWLFNLFPWFSLSLPPPVYNSTVMEPYQEYHTFSGPPPGSEIVDRERISYKEGAYTVEVTLTISLLDQDENVIARCTATFEATVHAQLLYDYPPPDEDPYYGVDYEGEFDPGISVPMIRTNETLQIDGTHESIGWTFEVLTPAAKFHGVRFERAIESEGDYPAEPEAGAATEMDLYYSRGTMIDLTAQPEPESEPEP